MYQKNALAEVWHSNQVWDSNREHEYQEWVSKTLTTNVFTSDEGILGGLATDCADALYAIRIAFAYEKSLPFEVNAPEVLRKKMKYFGSTTSMFDHIKNEKNRVRAFIEFVIQESGTESLINDTYPVQINEIDSGIIYVVEWSLFGKPERHSYILKGFNEYRELLYYASDAPIKVRKLQIDTKYPRFSYSEAPFGFRRWKHPEHLALLESHIPKVDGYGLDQYELLKRVGKKGILKEIHRILKNK
jgi:hypothetical protein